MVVLDYVLITIKLKQEEVIVDALSKMKESVINDYYHMLKRFKKADYNISYQNILNKILFIEAFRKFDKVDGIYEKLIIL